MGVSRTVAEELLIEPFRERLLSDQNPLSAVSALKNGKPKNRSLVSEPNGARPIANLEGRCIAALATPSSRAEGDRFSEGGIVTILAAFAWGSAPSQPAHVATMKHRSSRTLSAYGLPWSQPLPMHCATRCGVRWATSAPSTVSFRSFTLQLDPPPLAELLNDPEVFLRVSPVIAASSLTASHTVRRFSSDRHGSCAAFVYSRLLVPLRSPSRHLVRLYPSSIAYSDAYSRLEGVQTPVDVTRNATQRAPPQLCT